jgi:predicted nuclease of predicted toxin-antitoxin system
MRLLLDENLPKRLKIDFSAHEVYTVREMGWNGIKNGELIRLLLADNFDVLLTFDKNLQHQQNFSKYAVTVIVLTADNNTYLTLSSLSPKVNFILDTEVLSPGIIIVSSDNRGS